MNDRVSKLDLILLFFNTTGYTIAQGISPNSSFINKSHMKGTGFLLIILIEYSLFDFVFGHVLKTPFYVVTVLTVAFMLIHGLLEIISAKKIELISQNYLSYYNMLFIVLFILCDIAGLVYLFMFA
nr:hypothetical protein [Mucilaginibacter sp. X5P1]MBB6139596.1 hypothetical protein [Mucilaginibacter sp. X5P1]